MEIRELYTRSDPPYWIARIAESGWRAGAYLAERLRDGRFPGEFGADAEVFLLTRAEMLLGYCILAERDNIRPTELSPWIGFLFVAPEERGKGLAGRLLAHTERRAAERGCLCVYLSTEEIGLYEKYGYTFQEVRQDFEGRPSRIYRKSL